MTTTPRTRPARALVRVLRAPGLLLALWIGQLVFAWLLALPVRAVGKAAMGPFTWFDDGHRLRALVELLIHDPAVAAAIATSLASSAMLAVVFAIVVGPAVITRLHGPTRAGELGRASGQHLAAMIVQTLYGLVPRAIFGGLAAAALASFGPSGLPLAIVLAAIPTLALDRARVAVVLEQARPMHPKTHLCALLHVLRRPLWLFAGALIDALQILVGIAALVLVISPTGVAMGGGALWVARLAGLLALGLGLWRISLAVEGATPTPADHA
ncbi:hypothetical protein ACNOYE_23790 [Nannocystaceae bacterium ST9]